MLLSKYMYLRVFVKTGWSLRAMFCSCSLLFNFGAMLKRLKGPRSVDQNKARRVLEERLIVHFLSPS